MDKSLRYRWSFTPFAQRHWFHISPIRSRDETQIWDLHTTDSLKIRLQNPRQSLLSISATSLSEDGTIIACGLSDGSIGVWDVLSGSSVGPPQHTWSSPTNCLEFSPNGQFLASASIADGTVRLWDVKTFNTSISPPSEMLALWNHCFAFSPDSAFLATIGGDDIAGAPSLVIWDTHSKLHFREVAVNGSYFSTAVYSPNGQQIATGSSTDWNVRLWDVNPPPGHDSAMGLLQHDTPVTEIAYSPSGSRLASLCSAGGGASLNIWDPQGQQLLQVYLPDHDPFDTFVFKYSPDGKNIACGDPFRVRVWKLDEQGINFKDFDGLDAVSNAKYLREEEGKLKSKVGTEKSPRRTANAY